MHHAVYMYDLHYSVAPLFATHLFTWFILFTLLLDDRSFARFWNSISLMLGKFVASFLL